jgi:ferredoxin-NADP reductase
MNVILDHTKDETENIRTFYFQPPKKVDYTAGQFIEMHLPHKNPDERGDKHWFTLSSSPSEELLSITTKFAGEKSSTFKKKLFSLKPGAEVDMSDPMGDFVLPKLVQTPLIWVAGGIGLTPFHSMMKWLADTGEQRNIKFIYGVRNEDEIVFQDTMKAAGVHATIVVGEPSPTWGGETGRLSAEMILGLTKPSEDALIYISGPEPMVESLEKQFHAAGIKKNQLVLDFFPNYENTYSS